MNKNKEYIENNCKGSTVKTPDARQQENLTEYQKEKFSFSENNIVKFESIKEKQSQNFLTQDQEDVRRKAA